MKCGKDFEDYLRRLVTNTYGIRSIDVTPYIGTINGYVGTGGKPTALNLGKLNTAFFGRITFCSQGNNTGTIALVASINPVNSAAFNTLTLIADGDVALSPAGVPSIFCAKSVDDVLFDQVIINNGSAADYAVVTGWVIHFK